MRTTSCDRRVRSSGLVLLFWMNGVAKSDVIVGSGVAGQESQLRRVVGRAKWFCVEQGRGSSPSNGGGQDLDIDLVDEASP